MVARTALLLFALAGAIRCTTTAPPAPPDRPATWAEPLAAVAGLPNLHRVTPALYRSAQPTDAGLKRLAGQQPLEPGGRPVRTVVSLRSLHDDDVDVGVAGGPPLRLETIRFASWDPEDEEVVAFLRMATTPGMQPLLVHCHYGADRTGTMVAAYRVVVQGWSKAEAVREMTDGGFGFHPVWNGLVDYVMGLDVDAITKAVADGGPWQ